MAAPWQGGTQYQPGDIVRPTNAGAVTIAALGNPGFESGDTGWTKGAGWAIGTGQCYSGTKRAAIGDGGSGEHVLTNNTKVTTAAGSLLTVRGRAQCTGGSGQSTASKVFLRIHWLDEDDTELRADDGVAETEAGSIFENWLQITATAIAPANSASWKVSCVVDGNADFLFDSVDVDYAYQAPVSGLLFRATQSTAGFSGAVEPDWPDTLAETVTDNEVTWTAVAGTNVTWEAHRILVSGSTEPTWPTKVHAAVLDNTISWQLDPRQVTDDNVPQSELVAIASSKVFTADKDIVPFSATVNPLDWSTKEDAGYLPFGLQTYGANPVKAMGLYRGNLIVFNSVGAQIWQVDEDPTAMALLDAVPIGCTYPKTVQPVANDLVFLTDLGIRSLGLAGSSINLQAGYFGKAVDDLVIASIADAATNAITPRGLYWPAQGQYWLFFGGTAYVLTMNGTDSSWSTYVFPSAIDDWTILGDDLYLRSGNKVWKVDEDATQDDQVTASGVTTGTDFKGELQWHFLDLGTAPGRTKQLVGFDLVGSGEVKVSVGYNQKKPTFDTSDGWTAEFTITDADTLEDGLIPLPVTAPSFALHLEFGADQAWEFQAATLYVQDLRPGS